MSPAVHGGRWVQPWRRELVTHAPISLQQHPACHTVRGGAAAEKRFVITTMSHTNVSKFPYLPDPDLAGPGDQLEVVVDPRLFAAPPKPNRLGPAGWGGGGLEVRPERDPIQRPRRVRVRDAEQVHHGRENVVGHRRHL